MRAFTTGLTPLTIGLLVATGWVLAGPTSATGAPLGAIALIAVAIGVMMRTRISPMWLVASAPSSARSAGCRVVEGRCRARAARGRNLCLISWTNGGEPCSKG